MDENEKDTTATAALLTPPPFAVDEPVFCPDMNNHSAYYEAVIRKSRFEQGTWSFLVHYTGWNSRWDRWMDAGQIWKDTAENRARTLLQNAAQTPQQHEGGELQQQENNSTEQQVATTAPATTMSGSSSNKRSRTDSPHADHSHAGVRRKRLAVRNHMRPAAAADSLLVYQDYCELPFTLKTVLVEEYERITAASRLRLVHALPAPVPVSKVLNHFAKKKTKECSGSPKQQQNTQQSASDAPNNATTTTTTMTPEIVQSFVQGLTRLWEQALPTCLLYPQERPQYEALLLQQQRDNHKNDNNPDGGNTTRMRMVDCYGCEYLLRLFVRLPLLLQQQTAAATTTAAAGSANNCWSSPTVIGPLLTDLLVLMQKNRQALFPVTIGGAVSSDSNNNSASTNYRPPAVHELLDWEQPAGSPKKQPRGPAPLSPMDTR